MRDFLKIFLVSSLIATASAAQSMVDWFGSDNGAQGLGSSNGGGNSGLDPLAEAIASSAFNYTVESLSQADGSSVTLVPNEGLYGSSWDADTVVSSGGTITYEQSSDCVSSWSGCILSNNAMIRMGAADTAKTPTKDIQCFVGAGPGADPGLRDTYGWAGVSGSHNQIQIFGGLPGMVYDTTFQYGATSVAGAIYVMCWDGTTQSSVTVSQNGAATLGPVDMSGVGARQPQQIHLGGSFSGVDGLSDEIYQAVGWSEDPGLSIVELSQLLLDYWS